EVAHLVEQRCLEAREGEVEPGDARDRERERLGVPVPRQPVDRGTAGVTQPEEPRTFVERLPRRVIERRPEHLEGAVVADVEQLRVPPASTVSRRESASSSARLTAGRISSRWCRDATSGTTPPYGACNSAWDETTLARTPPSRVTRAAAVSSHDVSIPRITA